MQAPPRGTAEVMPAGVKAEKVEAGGPTAVACDSIHPEAAARSLASPAVQQSLPASLVQQSGPASVSTDAAQTSAPLADVQQPEAASIQVKLLAAAVQRPAVAPTIRGSSLLPYVQQSGHDSSTAQVALAEPPSAHMRQTAPASTTSELCEAPVPAATVQPSPSCVTQAAASEVPFTALRKRAAVGEEGDAFWRIEMAEGRPGRVREDLMPEEDDTALMSQDSPVPVSGDKQEEVVKLSTGGKTVVSATVGMSTGPQTSVHQEQARQNQAEKKTASR